MMNSSYKDKFYKNLENRVSYLENKFNRAGVQVKIYRKKTKKTKEEILSQRIKDSECFESQPYRDCLFSPGKNRSKT